MLRASFVAMLSFAAVLPVRSAAPSVGERVIALILDAPAATNAVWPGFSLPDRDWLLYDATGAYLVTKSAPPASFAPGSAGAEPAVGARRASRRSTESAPLPSSATTPDRARARRWYS